MIKVIDTIEGLETLRDEWTSLAQSPAMQVFQTYDWCYWAWDKFLSKENGVRLYILRWTGSKGESPIIFPTYIDRNGSMRFLNDSHCDCCNALYVPGGNKHIAFKEIAEFILADKRIKSVMLQKLHADSELLHYFGVLWKDAVVYRDNTYSWINAPKGDSFIEALTHMKTKDRSCLKAILRKSAGDCVKIVSRSNGCCFPRTEITTIRDDMIRNGERGHGFFPESLVDFIEKIYDAGLCEIILLMFGESVKSLSFQLYKDNRTLCWIFMYEDPTYNLPLYLHYFDAKVKEMDFVIDFGVGTYDYKMGSFRPQTGCTFGIRWGRSWIDVFRGFKEMNWRLIKDCLKVRLRKSK